jgi:large subunit ribosomal protein L31e
MAKKEEKPKAVLERVYNVPLRKEFQKVASWRRTEKAVKALREFIAKHMKSEDIVIGKYANQLLWKNGIKSPPHHVKVTAIKDDKGKVTVELTELTAKAKREIEKEKGLKKKKEEKEAEKKKKEEEAKKAEEAKKRKDAQKSEISGTTSVGEKIEEKVEEVKKEKEEKAKEIEKEEIKELKKEIPRQHAPKKMPQQHFQESHPTAPKSQ